MPGRNIEKRKAWEEAYYAKNHARILEQKKLYSRAHRDERREYLRNYNAANKSRRRERELKKSYGISLAEYVQIFDSQKGVCAICQTSDWGKRSPFVDHDHATGKVRAILCARCNTILGLAADDPKLLRSMIAYLKHHNDAYKANFSRATEPRVSTPTEAV
jgi:uncharacterized protein